ncbi:MAG: iron ABC transporter permease [Thermoplasmata archaeon]
MSAGDPLGSPGVGQDPEDASARRRKRRVGERNFLLLLAALGGLLLVSVLLGDVPIPPGTILGIVGQRVLGGILPGGACVDPSLTANRCSILIEIVWQNYIPQVLLGVLVGAALGVSGAALQGTFRNPLADPYLLGLSSGAAVGAALLFIFHIGLAEANLTLPLFAFGGALLSGVVVLLAARSPMSSVTTLLLTGVALSSFFSALLVLALLYNINGDLQVSFWLLGGLEGATWTQVGIVFAGIAVTGSLLALYGQDLNLLQLGNDVAQSLGVDARRVRIRTILLASLCTSFAVAFAGVIGFVGLVAPHVVRRLLGVDYRRVLPASALVGAIFVLGARDLALEFFPGTEVPVGVPMAFAGALFFLYLLYRRPTVSGGRAPS